MIFWCCFLTVLDQSATDFDPDSVCGGPSFAPPSTSARVQSQAEIVELDAGMCSNSQGGVSAATGITGWYHVPGSGAFSYADHILWCSSFISCEVRKSKREPRQPTVVWLWRDAPTADCDGGRVRNNVAILCHHPSRPSCCCLVARLCVGREPKSRRVYSGTSFISQKGRKTTEGQAALLSRG